MSVEQALTTKFLSIFEVRKVSFDRPDVSHAGETLSIREQETMFVNIKAYKPKFREKVEHAKVEGEGVIFANADKMPLGFLSKCIAKHPDQCKDLFFYDLEQTEKIAENIVSRGFSFVYFFNGQYDPALGIINEITTEVDT